jgi:DNA-directed RNA polymerase subunit RPC12/RpoP
MGNCDGCKLLDLVDLIDDEESRYCNNCGADFDELVYERTVANGDIYHCSICKDEHIFPEQSAID